MDGARSPLEGSTSSHIPVALDATQDSLSTPSCPPAQAPQPAQATTFKIHSAFIPCLSIASPEQPCGSSTSIILSTAQSPPPHALSARYESSSDDSDFSPYTSPTKHAFTPTKSVTTPKRSITTPAQPIPSPMQFLSSPSQAVLQRLIPVPDKEKEESDDVVSTFKN